MSHFTLLINLLLAVMQSPAPQQADGQFGVGAMSAPWPASRWLEALKEECRAERPSSPGLALSFVVPRGKDAVPGLIRGLTYDEACVRESAAWALGEVGPSAAAAVPALIRALHDPEPRVQRNAAGALGQIGAASASAVPKLLELSQTTGALRHACRYSLTKLGVAAMPGLRDALRHADPAIRSEAALHLGAIGPAAAIVIPELTELLEDSPRVQCSAAMALLKFGPEAEPSVPALLHVIAEQWGGCGANVESRLERIGEAAVPHVARNLRADDRLLRRSAAIVLGGLASEGINIDKALPHLREALFDSDRHLSSSAGLALGRMGTTAMPTLREALQAEHAMVRRNAIGGLRASGGEACHVVDVLIVALEDTDEVVAANAARLLGSLGEAMALPALTGALEDHRPRVNEAAAWALAKMESH